MGNISFSGERNSEDLSIDYYLIAIIADLALAV
jgi:hypothetical protein